MNKKINDILLNNILMLIPKNIAQTSYLSQLLKVDEKYIKKRIKGETQFTFDEISIISYSLGISIDKIVGNGIDNTPQDNLVETLIGKIKISNSILESMKKADKTEIIIALGQATTILMSWKVKLFQFLFYKWNIQLNVIPKDTPLSAIQIRNDVISLYDRYCDNLEKIDNCTLIINPTLISSLITEIQHDHRKGLISKQELYEIRNELTQAITELEMVATKGVSRFGKSITLFISEFSIGPTSLFFAYNQTVGSQFWTCPVTPITTFDPQISKEHREWLLSLKKFACSITKSNQMLQANFFEEQREHIQSLVNDKITKQEYEK
jgi:hypothetical protein